MVRSLLLKLVILGLLGILLLPALLYLTSPWWAPQLVGWAAQRYWRAELRPATATVNPFQLRIEGAGGTFQGPPGKSYATSGDLSSFSLDLEALPFLRERRIRSASLRLATLTVTVKEGKGVLPQSWDRPGPGVRATPALLGLSAAGPWTIDELFLRVDRGVLRYTDKGRRGEMSMDLNLEATFRRVVNSGDLEQRILQELLSKAAYGFMAERLFQ